MNVDGAYGWNLELPDCTAVPDVFLPFIITIRLDPDKPNPEMMFKVITPNLRVYE